MQHEVFLLAFIKRQEEIKDKMFYKGAEYSTIEDQFHNFKRAGRIQNCTPEKALIGMKTKHDVSILDIVDKIEVGHVPDLLLVQEKIRDSIIYLHILESLIVERIENENIHK